MTTVHTHHCESNWVKQILLFTSLNLHRYYNQEFNSIGRSSVNWQTFLLALVLIVAKLCTVVW